MTPGRAGRILQVSVSPGGLPKLPVQGAVAFRREGVEGDHNRYRTERLGGDPDSAVLLLTQDVLDGYAREGYPVKPGSLGENVTLVGVPYEELRAGQRWRLGPQAEIELSRPCEPCDEVAVYGKEFVRHSRGRRGWYARVLVEGPVSAGDGAVEG